MKDCWDYASHDEIAQNRMLLMDLHPDPENSRLLNYLMVCELGKEKFGIIYLTDDPEKRKEYEERFGNFTAPMFSLFKYNNALKRAIKNLELFRTVRT